jgi:dTDP-4-dehydrorhamnose 3,5-epimerase
MIEGVMVTGLKRIPNSKGDIYHAMKSSSQGFAGFGEAYFSAVHPGETKGWKRHRSATLNLIVSVGSVRFVIFDDRIDSMTNGHFLEFIVGENNFARLTVHPGLWVAFQCYSTTGSMLLNISNEEHDPMEADNRDLLSIPFPW